MEIDMSLHNIINNVLKNPTSKSVRIEPIEPFQINLEILTETVWFENHNIEECIRTVERLGIEHIHTQTNTIAFLDDSRMKNIKGITIQFEIESIKPLFKLRHLTHLNLSSDVKTEIGFDFSNFENLIFLGGTLPRKYINLNKLSNLKYTYLFDHKKSDLSEFAMCKDLRLLHIYNAKIENLKGLANLASLKQIDLEKVKNLTSLDGLSNENISLDKIHIVNCKQLRNADALADLPGLRQLGLYQINKLESLAFLRSLNKLEKLMLHPQRVGVEKQDYYPLIDTLKKLGLLGNLKGWKPLNDYLQNNVVIE